MVCARSVYHQRNEQLFGLLFAISFSRRRVHVSPLRSICSLLNQKSVFETLRFRGHTAAGALFMTKTLRQIVFSRFSATGYNFLYTRRNDYSGPLRSPPCLSTNWLRYTLCREVITPAYAAAVVNEFNSRLVWVMQYNYLDEYIYLFDKWIYHRALVGRRLKLFINFC